MSRARFRRLWLMAATMIVVLLATGAVWRGGYIPARTPECAQRGVTKAVWIGDSYPLGQGVGADAGYACRVAAKLDWNLTLDAQGSTGFVSDGHQRNRWFKPLPDRLPDLADRAGQGVSLVVVDAGRNDATFPVEAVSDSAERYLTRLQETWPDARLVVILPWLITDDAEPAELVAAVRDAAHHAGAEVIDPVAQGWATSLQGAIQADGVHPSRRGHEKIGDQLAQRLGAG